MPSGPPLLLEQIVVTCLPPASREAVAGDLYEMYRSPLQYGWQAATTLPLLIASQARRNANLPVLGLQSLVLFACLDGAFSMMHLGATISHAYAALGTALGLVALVVREAYQSLQRPTCRRAILETMFLCGIVQMLFPLQLLLPYTPATAAYWWPGFAFLGLLMTLVPVLCCLRAGLILEVDRRNPDPADDMAAGDMPGDYRRFRAHAVWQNRIESAGLLAAAAGLALLGRKLEFLAGMGGAMVIGAYVSAALYLALDGRALPFTTDARVLRTLYQYELARRHQLRRFLWWLWSAPLFLGLYQGLILPGIAASHSAQVSLGIVAALLLGFFVSALNREGAGPIQEKISLLGRMTLELAE